MKTLNEAIIEAEYLTQIRGLVHIVDVLHKVHMKALYEGKGIYETTIKPKEDVKEIEILATKKGKRNTIVTQEVELLDKQEDI